MKKNSANSARRTRQAATQLGEPRKFRVDRGQRRAGAEGARQHQPVDALRMTRGEHLRDHAAERRAEDMGARVAERRDQCGRIVGQLGKPIGRGGLRVPPESRWS